MTADVKTAGKLECIGAAKNDSRKVKNI